MLKDLSNLLARGKHVRPLGAGHLDAPNRTTIVFGTDNRTLVTATSAQPWRMICALKIMSSAGVNLGTGWLAGPKTVITAGHCVYDRSKLDGWATTIEVSPGRDGDYLPFATSVSAQFDALPQWIADQDPNHDIGHISLAQPVGNGTGWFSAKALDDSELREYDVNVAGYPMVPGNAERQYFHRSRVLGTTEGRVVYEVDTSDGQSGSPAWIYEDERANAAPVVVGVHAQGSANSNSAVRITSEILSTIRRWIDEDRDA